MTKHTVTKKHSSIKSIIFRIRNRKAYLRSLEQDFAKQSLQITDLKRRLKLAQI